MKTYYCALLKKEDGETVVIKMCADQDIIDPDAWVYLGVRRTTKKLVRKNKELLRQAINFLWNTRFKRIEVD